MILITLKENEILEVTSGSTHLTIKLCGSGLKPSCKITPDKMFNIIQTTYEYHNSEFTFQVFTYFLSSFFYI